MYVSVVCGLEAFREKGGGRGGLRCYAIMGPQICGGIQSRRKGPGSTFADTRHWSTQHNPGGFKPEAVSDPSQAKARGGDSSMGRAVSNRPPSNATHSWAALAVVRGAGGACDVYGETKEGCTFCRDVDGLGRPAHREGAT